MSILTLQQAYDQIRLTMASDEEAANTQDIINSAESFCASYLARNVYPDAATRAAAQAAVPDMLAAAQTAWQAVYASFGLTPPCGFPWVQMTRNQCYWRYDEMENPIQAMQIKAADDAFKDAFVQARRTYNGLACDDPVAGPAFIQAAKLMVGHMDLNREALITENTVAIEMPMGVRDILFPHRKELGV